MSGVKISALPAADAANDTDQLETNQSGTSRRVTVDQLGERIASSDWIQDQIAALPLSPLDFGAAMDGVTDDTAAFEALMLAAASTGKTINLGNGHAKLSRQINVPPDVAVIYGICTLDWSAVGTLVPADFPDSACLQVIGDVPIQISDLGANVAAGDQTITLAIADSSIVEGDVLLIHDPTDGSFSGFRTYYRAGEQCVVMSVSGATIQLQAPLYAAYVAATVNVYKCSRKTTSFSGGKLSLVCSGAVSCGVSWVYLRKPALENIEASGADTTCLSIDNCYGVRGSNLAARHFLTVQPNRYGMILAHSQNARLYGVDLFGGTHGLTSGGGLNDPAPVNRDYEIHGTFSNQPGNGSTVLSVLMHGNSEFYHVSGQCTGGIAMGGNHGKFSGRIQAHKPDGCAISLVEAVGLDFDCSNVIIEAPQSVPVGPGIIEISGVSSNISANTKYGGTFRLNNMRVNAPLATRIVRASNNGYIGAQRLIIDMTGFHIVSATVSGSTVHLATGSGTDSWHVLLNNFISEIVPAFNVSTGCKAYDPTGLPQVNVASAATVLLDNRFSDRVNVTGNTTITAFTLAEGQTRTLKFASTPTITAGASLIIPGGSKTATAGDVAVVRGYASGVVQVVSYAVA